MGDMKDKMKGFMKKVNNSLSSSSSSGKFKGQGRVLGSSSSSSIQSGHVNSIPNRPDPKPSPPPRPVSPKKVKPDQPQKSTNGFDPFDALITTGKRNKNGYDLKVFECPVCTRAFGSEQDVSDHVETCLIKNESKTDNNVEKEDTGTTLEACFSTYVSGKPSNESVEIVLKLLKNVVKDPENEKFRRIRLGNPKIKAAIADVAGGLDLLECVGFELKEESSEMWAVMDAASSEKVQMIKETVWLLESSTVEKVPPPTAAQAAKEAEPVEVKKVERQVYLVKILNVLLVFCVLYFVL